MSNRESEPRLYPTRATPWDMLTYPAYREALTRGHLVPGVTFERPYVGGKPTAVCVHGWHGTPSDFKHIGTHIRSSANLAFFLYDDHSGLANSAEMLRRDLRALRGPCFIVAFSMGVLLPAYASTTDSGSELHALAALYLNPLIGGTRYADADPVLATLDQIPALRWLHSIKRLVFRAFFPDSVRDLDPGSRFQQAIFGQAAPAPTFRERTTIIWTEDGSSPDRGVSPYRVPTFFGCSRDDLLRRLGHVAVLPSGRLRGHRAPVRQSRRRHAIRRGGDPGLAVSAAAGRDA